LVRVVTMVISWDDCVINDGIVSEDVLFFESHFYSSLALLQVGLVRRDAAD
jgi:hypothetical protein